VITRVATATLRHGRQRALPHLPQTLTFIGRQTASGAARVDARPKEQFVAEEIANSRDH
jgi:hypothetical protein